MSITYARDTIKNIMQEYLIKLVKTGNLTEILSMYKINANIITESYPFLSHNADGHLHIAHSPIAYCLFRAACIDGHLHIMQWLFQVKPDIDISERSETTFRLACDFNHLHIAKWLYQLRPYHYILQVNEQNEITHYGVKSFAERKWLERCEPLMAHYGKKEENQNNIFRYLPKDVVRNICEFV